MEQAKNKQEPNEPVNLGEYIRGQRLKHGMSLRQLAEKLQLDRSYISRLEAGHYKHPSPEVLQRIALVLEIDYQDLFAITGYTAPEGLPSFVPYLRAKYPYMDDATARQLDEYRLYIMRRHHIPPGRRQRPEPEDPVLPGPLPDFS